MKNEKWVMFALFFLIVAMVGFATYKNTIPISDSNLIQLPTTGLATGKPVITMSSPVNNEVFAPGETKEFRWTVTQNAQAISYFKVMWYHKQLVPLYWQQVPGTDEKISASSYDVVIPSSYMSSAYFCVFAYDTNDGILAASNYIQAPINPVKIKAILPVNNAEIAVKVPFTVKWETLGLADTISSYQIIYLPAGKSMQRIENNIQADVFEKTIVINDKTLGVGYLAVLAIGSNGKTYYQYPYTTVKMIKPAIQFVKPVSLEMKKGEPQIIAWEYSGQTTAIGSLKVMYYHRGITPNTWKELSNCEIDYSNGQTADDCSSAEVIIPNDGYTGNAYMTVFAYDNDDQYYTVSSSYLNIRIV